MKWIDVGEELPEIPKDHFCVEVIVVNNSDTTLGHWNGQSWNHLKFKECSKHPEWDWNQLKGVTHWMYLPEPPK